MNIVRLNMSSKAYTGNTTFPASPGRTYFQIVNVDVAATIEFGNGGGLVPLAIAEKMEMLICPVSEMSVVTTGTFVVISDKQV